MTPNQVLVGDCLVRMQEIPAGWAHCAVTSPPYFALRSYLRCPACDQPSSTPDCRHCGHYNPKKLKEIGSEPTPDAFIQTLVEVFRGVRRILRDDGVLWLNLGDSYDAGTKARRSPSGCTDVGRWRDSGEGNSRTTIGLHPGCQLLMPHRVALALIADGWCLRSTVVWSKASPMPESVSGWRWRRCRVKVGRSRRATGRKGEATEEKPHAAYADDGKGFANDAKYELCPGCPKCLPNGGYILRRGRWRPTNSFEYIFMFSKGGDYFCDGDAVAEEAPFANSGRQDKKRGALNGKNDLDPQMPGREAFRAVRETRNPRSVWTFPNEPFKGKHFATFPSGLAARCIQASTSSAGCCAACGACYAPIVESVRKPTRPATDSKVYESFGSKQDEYGDRRKTGFNARWKAAHEVGNRDPERHVTANIITGYRATCGCGTGTAPCRVFDPFLGSGQTARAAHWLGRDWLGCELNPVYAEMVPGRIAKRPKWAKSAPRCVSDIVSELQLWEGLK